MSNDQSSAQTYTLGHAPEEIQRLLKQGQFLNPFTRRLLEDAGLRAGMKVLDVGCGPGDVSLMAAELVGEEGLVIGVDTNASVLDIARARAQAASLRQVSFLAGDIGDLARSQECDAIVGRLILQHVRQPASLLRLLAQRLHPGGLLAFQEYNITGLSEWIFPPSPLWEQAATWCREVYQRVGLERRMGMKLYGTFLSAGLPAPQLRYETAIGAGPVGADIAEHHASLVRTLLPLILQFEIATAEEIGVETLTERLREEIVSREGVARMPGLVSAWTHASEA